ncbi:TetR/AcrR family transcriptional regulator [Thermocrispum municipale]|uniref:TetR/AcrR family transcriptional regulator n=1 Tax=Thermocrispum municipale TaxID=37926 RepID=UPI001FE21D98|nr:TetR/AcrR family transcriptional regulator [Thermocrispum municipale]
MADGVKNGSTRSDARRDRWRRHRIERRAEFVEAALRAIDKHGPDFGMEDVAVEAGVTKPVLYRHFTDKADLLVALGQKGTEILFNRLMPALNQELAPLPRIRRVIDAFFTTVEEYPNLYRLLVHPPPHAAEPASTDIAQEDKRLIASAVTAVLGDYMRAFGMDSGAAEPWAHGVVGLVQNVGEWWLERRSMSKEAVVEYTTEIIWAAIDGVLRQHGHTVDPNKPLELNKVITMRDTRGDATGVDEIAE